MQRVGGRKPYKQQGFGGGKQGQRLVGHSHAEATEAGERVQERAELVHKQRHIHRIEASRGQRRVVQCRAAAVRHWIAHNPIHLQEFIGC